MSVPREAGGGKGVLIVGATSGMAREAAICFAREGARLFLVGRTPAKLDEVVDRVRAAGAQDVVHRRLDVTELESDPGVVDEAVEALGALDIVLIAHGVLPDQERCEEDVGALVEALDVNAMSVMALLVPVANHMESRGEGTIAVITSVAGERGRRENYVYGAAKSAVSTYLQGLRARLHPAGVAVVDIRPGPVRTPMTEHKRGGWLYIEPQTAGRLIHRAIRKRRDIAYVPWWWMLITMVMRLIPEWLFKRTDVRAG